MLAASIFRRLRAAAARFSGANQGNVAVIFGIAILPVMGLVGASIDYSRANAARSSMQAALDSTALMMSKDLSSGTFVLSGTPAQHTAQLNAKALAYFTGLYTNPDAKVTPNSLAGTVPVITAIYTPTTSTGSTIVLTGAGQIQTDFMKVLNVFGTDFSNMHFNTTSTTTWGNVKMRVALALDNTGSMQDNNKIVALRNAVAATGGLIDQLSALAQNPGDVYISVIPFAKVVNVGTSNSAANWIDWTDWLNPPTTQPANAVGSPSNQANLPGNWHGYGPGMTCPFTNSNDGFVCTTSPANGDSTVSTIPSSGTYKGYICPSVDANSHTLYNGCWDSELVTDGTAQAFCTGPSSACFCPGGSSSCSCTHSGSVYTCKGPRYIHNWTQPAPSDTTHNMSQPHLSVQVGFNYNDTAAHLPTATNPNPNPYWVSGATVCANPASSLNCMTPAYNNWKQASTNPISNWTGCVTDRFQNYDETGDAPNTLVPATLFPANEYYENSIAYCNSSSNPTLEPIIPLTYTWATLKTAVNAMQPTGGTNQSVGLAWAWQSLLTTGPIPAPAEDPSITYNRVIIILSDGLNTEDRWSNYGNGSTQNTNSSGLGDIDVRQAQQCANIKAAIDSKGKPMFTVYTIQVNTSSPADPTSSVLQNCATDSTKFFMLTSSTQIATTFTTIGTALSQLRVSN
jgi:Flp pilus assembly protein TadG